MDQREIDILDAALQVFLRYGVKRSSMADIAAEAGISRQTLYKYFSDKDAVLRGAIGLFTRRAMEAIGANLPAAEGVAAKLAVVFEHMALVPYDILSSSPHGADVIVGMNAASRAEIEDNDAAFEQVLEGVFAPYAAQLKPHGLTVAALAENVRLAVSAAKHEAADRAHLDALLKAQSAIVLALVGKDAGAS
ncbi:MAG: helix-turn-helix domain-containing protein [Pseudomonadota bacterium]